MLQHFASFLQANLDKPIQWFVVNICFTFIVLSVAWYFCEKIKNATFVDVIWAVSFGIIASYYTAIGTAPQPRKLLLLIAILPWSLRLFLYLLYRTCKKHPQEDERYAQFRRGWGSRQAWLMFLVFQFQGLLIAILSLPFAAIAMNNSPYINITEIIGTILCFLGFLGGRRIVKKKITFVSQKSNQGKTCNVGLWQYSRHPNYFFEWVVWLGIFTMSFSTHYGFIFLYCPLLIFYMLTKLSGVKLAEEHSLKSRGEEYKLYQQTTSSFFPWFKLPTKSKQG